MAPLIASAAADAFAPLAAGVYQGRIELGKFFNYFEHNGHEHAELGLRLDIAAEEQRVVRARFLIKSPTAFGIVRRDLAVLRRWSALVGAAPLDTEVNAASWNALVCSLSTAQRDHFDPYVGLTFTIRAYAGGGYIVDDVEAVLL